MGQAEFELHSIGQGCFYSGEITCAHGAKSTLVYDCGSLTSRPRLSEEIASLHRNLRGRGLDALILSHLDADHVNGLARLIDEHLHVRTVYLPHLTPVQRLIAAIKSPRESRTYYDFLSSPIDFFEGRNVDTVVFVRGDDDGPEEPADGDQPPTMGPKDHPDHDPIPIERVPDDEEGKAIFLRIEPSQQKSLKAKAKFKFITHQHVLRLGNCWQMKFFHKDPIFRVIEDLTGKSLRDEVHDPIRLKIAKKFLRCVSKVVGSLNSVKIVNAIRDPKKRRVLRRCYDLIDRIHNEVSLVLWHGPTQRPIKMTMATADALASCPPFKLLNHPLGISVTSRNSPHGSTFLTGDIALRGSTLTRCLRHFGANLENVAFFYVPHHGSRHCWDEAILNVLALDPVFLFSAGLENQFRHPSRAVVNSIYAHDRDWHCLWSNEESEIQMRVDF
jgi:beta-lactamase superfamily II metal-dependent hydrolase